MTIILIILLALLVIYLYYRNQNTNAPKPPETKPWKEDLDHLQEQINELKPKDHD
ncbi:hypothetical protein [endosymbiont GvMRE of Glomus versiforme]|uniref:hypothetical protein n=1 Tax=endosymbiont GvMRE of Glomus versiforme TaxID=2039283 RepID=UPI000EB85616|nr:hypothetical protein [endosymbiont GvMRE of Glomus versiforme]RHZ36303.1 hypothetical protein GvMRE_Ic1g104 [endosymbiont GvMRE of Glomus versiforme]